jgi:hypothetical protein
LEAAAKAVAKHRKWTITDELVSRLRKSFIRDREEARNPALQALCFLFSDLASYMFVDVSEFDWRSNPFLFRAFKIGVAKLLDTLEPRGNHDKSPLSGFIESMEKVNPEMAKHFAEITKSPEVFAENAVSHTLANFYRTEPAYKRWEKVMQEVNEEDAVAGRLYKDMEQTFYGMARARDALAIKPRGKKP